jgi:hypothetical protein
MAVHEKTRENNPNRLTINRHVFPKKSIERFYNSKKAVGVSWPLVVEVGW